MVGRTGRALEMRRLIRWLKRDLSRVLAGAVPAARSRKPRPGRLRTRSWDTTVPVRGSRWWPEFITGTQTRTEAEALAAMPVPSAATERWKASPPR